ncbi:MAG: hypothetical protein SGILL_000270 [Bacillariaceae sp.]
MTNPTRTTTKQLRNSSTFDTGYATSSPEFSSGLERKLESYHTTSIKENVLLMTSEKTKSGADQKMKTEDNNKKDEASSSTLSVIPKTGLTATTSTAAAADNKGNRDSNTASSDRNQPSSSSASAALDFISTGTAVKALFSIPFSEDTTSETSPQQKPVCLAVHNFDGTLIIDQAVDEENYFNNQNIGIPSPIVNENSDPTALLPTSKESLALTLISQDGGQSSEALSLLSNMARRKDFVSQESKQNTSATLPQPPREYVEWRFQDMNLLVGSDALIVRPSRPVASGEGGESAVAVRVEEVNRLRNAWNAFQLKQEKLLQEAQASQRSYAQALKHKPNVLPKKESKEDTFSEVPLQTCVVPAFGSMGGRLLQGSSQALSDATRRAVPKHTPSPDEATVPSSTPALSIVLDAYLDNLMTNVPQLALCLQEKGLVQSVKFLQTEDIPSMMIHPSTLDTTAPPSPFSRNMQTQDHVTNEMFSPRIMKMNASALLQFLKANCTRNNTTYLLRHDPVDANGGDPKLQHHNIQLYDISSLSTQGQKKWIWWLATTSYRFGLRLRHLETASSSSPTSSISEAQKRAIRDRERSLFQQTLDLLQDLMDMDGNAHESLVASVREHMADTYLASNHFAQEQTPASVQNHSKTPAQNMPVSPVVSSSTVGSTSLDAAASKPGSIEITGASDLAKSRHQQPYALASVDALNKAHDHLLNGINALSPLLEPFLKSESEQEAVHPTKGHRRRKRPGEQKKPNLSMADGSMDLEGSQATVLQMLGLHYKLVNVSLHLAEHHLKNYYSSSAMQALRTSARNLADSVYLLNFYRNNFAKSGRTMDGAQFDVPEKAVSLQLQYIWLFDHCGHFARSFASDEEFRRLGHSSGEDVISVLRDVEAAFSTGADVLRDVEAVFSAESAGNSASSIDGDANFDFLSSVDCDELSRKTNGRISLQSLTGALPPCEMNVIDGIKAIKATEDFLGEERVLQREKRRVLVASCVCYSRAITALRDLVDRQLQSSFVLNVLEQRRGDSLNETGKALLAALQISLIENQQGVAGGNSTIIAETLLHSAQFWFSEALESFEACNDAQNASLVRCNICQSFKFKANAIFAKGTNFAAKHAEDCLQSAANELIKAHEVLIQRDKDPILWDTVSEQLASTFLVLGTRRRQSLLGGVSINALFPARKLSPGEERSIIEPMEGALKVYEQSGNAYQAAATRYQLALTFSKMWTRQSNESNARKKLALAFEHYSKAYGYFATHLSGNESTYCLLCLDLASLYATLTGEEGMVKALGCCLDTCPAFSIDTCKVATASNLSNRDEWFETMSTLSTSVEERVMSLLKSLAKHDQERYKDLYRAALSAKIKGKVCDDQDLAGFEQVVPLLSLHELLMAVKGEYDSLSTSRK